MSKDTLIDTYTQKYYLMWEIVIFHGKKQNKLGNTRFKWKRLSFQYWGLNKDKYKSTILKLVEN